MSDFSTLRRQAEAIAAKAPSTQVAELAAIVAQMCSECEDVKKAADDAKHEAKRARRA